MAMLKEEQKALRDEFERTYGIRIRQDDELLPILHFIKKASEDTRQSSDRSKVLIEEFTNTAAGLFSESAQKFGEMYLKAGERLSTIHENSRKDLGSLPHLVLDLKKSISAIPHIPEEFKVNHVQSFDKKTLAFLWKYFSVSVFCIAISVGLAFYFWYQNREIVSQYKPGQHKWLINYYNHMKGNASKVSKEFIDQNPIPED